MNLLASFAQFLLLLLVTLSAAALANLDATLSKIYYDLHTEWALLLVVTLTASLFQTAQSVATSLKAMITETIMQRRIKHILKTLKPGDKMLLAQFMVGDVAEIFVAPSISHADWLASCKIIYATGNVRSDLKRGYRLAVWARDYLAKNPNLLY